MKRPSSSAARRAREPLGGPEEIDLEAHAEREREAQRARRHARVRVRVEEARKERVPPAIDALRSGCLDLGIDPRDARPLDEHVHLDEALAVEDRRVVEEPGLARAAFACACAVRGLGGATASDRRRREQGGGHDRRVGPSPH